VCYGSMSPGVDAYSTAISWPHSSAPVLDVVDEESRDSGISMMDATSTDDDSYHDFSVIVLHWSLASIVLATRHGRVTLSISC